MQRQSQSKGLEQSPWFHCIEEESQIFNKVSTDQYQAIEVFSIQQDQADFSSRLGPEVFNLLEQPKLDNIYSSLSQKEANQYSDQILLTDNIKKTPTYKIKQIQGISKKLYKKGKDPKQHIYSKNYRQRKKEHFKVLEQQNLFLKKKIEELQLRLHEKQLEINKLKYSQPISQLSIEELNQHMMAKVNVVVEKINISHNLNSGQQSQFISSSNSEQIKKVYQEFYEVYDLHGFGGKKKIQLLDYYFNEILQNMLRDSEAYFCLSCVKNKIWNGFYDVQEYSIIDISILEIMDFEQNQLQRLKKTYECVQPRIIQLKNSCKQFYNCYKKILDSMDKIHNFMKRAYPENLQFSKRRIKMENWFQFNKYRKQLRTIRTDWIEFVKKGNETDVEDTQNMV